MSSTTVLINTDVDGNFTYQRPFFGLINAVMLDLGDMDFASLDVLVEDAVQDVTLHEFGELDADAFWQPGGPVACYGQLRVTVVNGGNTKHGSLRLMTTT
jgi:hypothetical protein